MCAKSPLISVSSQNVSTASNHFKPDAKHTSGDQNDYIYNLPTLWKKKNHFLPETCNYFMNTNDTKRTFQRNFHIKKRWNQNYLGSFFPPLSSDFRKEKFISAFIFKLDAIYCLSQAHFSLARRIHGPWQAMRICPPSLASGANMWKLA